LKKVGAVSRFIKKIQVLSCDFGIFLNFSELFCIEKVMDRVYGSWDRSWLSVHGGLTSMGQRGRFVAQEVIVIAQRERKDVVGVLTNDATWRRSCGDDHTMTLNRGIRWCSDGEMVLCTMRDWSRGGCGG
jgi:hypothetical protein